MTRTRRMIWTGAVMPLYLPADLQPSQGDADTLLEAKVAFRAKFNRWLAWARDLKQPVIWRG